MSGLVAITTALADQIRSYYVGVSDADGEIAFQVEPRYIINPTPPTIDVYPGPTPARDLDTAGMGFADEDGTIEDHGGYLLAVRARFGTADDDAGHELLYELCDDTEELSLSAAILEDATLDGNAASVDIQSFSGITVYPDGDGRLRLGFDFTVRVLPAFS